MSILHRPSVALWAVLVIATACSVSAPRPSEPPARPSQSVACETAAIQRARIPALVSEGRLDRVSRVIDRIRMLCSESAPETWAIEVSTLADLGRASEARALADAIESSAESNLEARAAATRARRRVEELTSEVAAPPKEAVAAALVAATKALSERRFGEAKRGFLDAWSWTRPNPHALYWAGHAAKEQGEAPDAQRLFDRAMSEAVQMTGKSPSVERPIVNFGPGAEKAATLAWSHDGRFLAEATYGAISIRDRVVGFTEVVRLDAPGPLGSIAFSKDGERLVAGGPDWVGVWETTHWTALHALKSDGWAAFHISADGTRFARGRTYAEIWDVARWTATRRIGTGAENLDRVAISPDGQTLAMLERNLRARLFDIESGAEKRELQPRVRWRRLRDGDPDIKSLAFSADGRTLAVAASGFVRAFDVGTGRLRGIVAGQPVPPADVPFSPDGRSVAIFGAEEGAVRFVDLATKAVVRRFDHPMHPQAISFSPDGKTLALARGSGTHHLIQLESADDKRELSMDSQHAIGAAQVWLSADGRTLVSVDPPQPDGSERLRMMDAGPPPSLRSKKIPRFDTYRVVPSPDGKQLASCSWRNTVQIWDVEEQARARELGSCNGVSPSAIAFSPNGERLAGGHVDHNVRVWDVKSGALSRTFDGHTDRVLSVAFSPDGKLLASGGSDGAVHIWDTGTSTPSRHIIAGSPVLAVAFSPDGNSLVGHVLGPPRATYRWDVSTGRELVHHPTSGSDIRHFFLHFAADGRTVTWGSNENILLWGAADGTPPTTVWAHSDGVMAAAYTKDGKALVTAGRAGLRVFTADGVPLLTIDTLPSRDTRYVRAEAPFSLIEIISDTPEASERSLLCRSGWISFPFELCRERALVPGMLAKVLAGDRSYADP